MKFEIIFDYFDDIVDNKGNVIDRIVRNDVTITEAEDYTDAKTKFFKYCTGIIRALREVR